MGRAGALQSHERAATAGAQEVPQVRAGLRVTGLILRDKLELANVILNQF